MLKFRFADNGDLAQYYEWLNDPLVRINSYNQNQIKYEDHADWFLRKITDPNALLYVFSDEENSNVGQVRIERYPDETIIGISVDQAFRKRSLGSDMLKMACADFFLKFPEGEIHAYIKKENTASMKAFQKADFKKKDELKYKGHESFLLIKRS